MVLEAPGRTAIPSRAIGVWRRLYTRFSLEPYPASVAPDVAKTIVPVTQADLLLQTPAVRTSLFAANVNTTPVAITVPAGERWLLYAYDLSLTSGDRQAFEARIRNPALLSMRFQTFASATSDVWRADQPFLMEPGWELQVGFDSSGTTDGFYTIRVLLKVEDLF